MERKGERKGERNGGMISTFSSRVSTGGDRAHCIKPMVSAQSRGALFGLYGLYYQSSQRSGAARRRIFKWKKSKDVSETFLMSCLLGRACD